MILNKKLQTNTLLRIQFYNPQKYLELDSTFFYFTFGNVTGFVLDYSCNQSEDVINEGIVKKLYTHSQKWLILTPQVPNAKNYLQQNFENSAFRMDSNILVATPLTPDYVELNQIYNPGFQGNGSLQILSVGFWNNSRKLYIEKSVNFYSQRKNMTNVVIKSATVNQEIHAKENNEQYLIGPHSDAKDILNKMNYYLFAHLIEMHHFTHILRVEKAWFGNTSSGEEAGMARLIYTEEVDVSSTSGVLRVARIQFYDFYMCTFRYGTSFVFRNPGFHRMWENAFLKPFSMATWYALLGMIILIIIFLRFSFCVGRRFTNDDTGCSFVTAIIVTIAVTCQQGSDLWPTYQFGRIIILSTLLMSLIVYNFYTSNVVSTLLSTKPAPLKDFDDLFDSGLNLATERAPYTRPLFKVISQINPKMRRVEKKLFPPGQNSIIVSKEDGVKLIKSGKYAYHSEISRLWPLIAKALDAKEICDLGSIPVLSDETTCFLIPKRSQYKNLFKISFRKMNEVGIFSRVNRLLGHKQPSCLSNANIAAVGIDQTFLAFLFLTYGHFLAMFILFMEIIINKIVQRMAQRKVSAILVLNKIS